MREILFRGKHVLDGRWIEGFYNGVRPDLATMQTKECHRILSLKSLAYDVDPDTVGQYTGLTDKHGKKIFEGDIVRAVLPKSNAIPEFVWPNMAVGFSEGAFAAMRGRYCTPLYSFAPTVEIEVIGSIHDNPELMEDK